MGNYLSVHVGPYIKVYAKPIEKIVEKTIKTCSNKECNINGKVANTKFCGTCGSETIKETIEIKEIKRFSHWHLAEEYGDIDIVYEVECDNPNEHILGINYRVKGLRKFSIDAYDYKSEYEIPDSKKSIEILKNSEEYKPFLEFLNKRNIKYEIKFGIICDYS